MKNSIFTEIKIGKSLKKNEDGRKVDDLCPFKLKSSQTKNTLSK